MSVSTSSGNPPNDENDVMGHKRSSEALPGSQKTVTAVSAGCGQAGAEGYSGRWPIPDETVYTKKTQNVVALFGVCAAAVMISTRPSRSANVQRQKALIMRAEAHSYQTGSDEAD
jgi:hypothetical protein